MKVKDGFKYGLGLTLGKFVGSICVGVINGVIKSAKEKKENEENEETEES